MLSKYRDIVPDFGMRYESNETWSDAESRVKENLSAINELLEPYHAEIKAIADRVLQEENSNPTHIEINRTVLNAYNPDFFDRLKAFPSVHTVFFQQDVEEMKKILVPRYYEYSSNDCDLIMSHSGYDNKTNMMFDNWCYSNNSVYFEGHELLEKNLRVGLPFNFKHEPGHETFTFMHVIHNAVVTGNGDVITGNLTLIPQRCRQDHRGNIPSKPNELDQLDEVFAVHQYWDTGFYHATLEGSPRLAPYVKFLNDNPQIKINFKSKNHIQQFYGINNLEERRITRQSFRAKVLYSPQGGSCGRSILFPTQLLSLYARKDLKNDRLNRNKIVLIRRSSKRMFKKHDEIAAMLKKEADDYGLELFVFRDDPVPDLETTRKMFNEAMIIVAPHGAGESNIIYSQPGTVLFEGLCWEVPRRVILCYRNAAQTLGLRYFGLFYSKNCLRVTADDVRKSLTIFLENLDTFRSSV